MFYTWFLRYDYACSILHLGICGLCVLSFHMPMVLKYVVEEMSLSQTNIQLEQINEPCSGLIRQTTHSAYWLDCCTLINAPQQFFRGPEQYLVTPVEMRTFLVADQKDDIFGLRISNEEVPNEGSEPKTQGGPETANSQVWWKTTAWCVS